MSEWNAQKLREMLIQKYMDGTRISAEWMCSACYYIMRAGERLGPALEDLSIPPENESKGNYNAHVTQFGLV